MATLDDRLKDPEYVNWVKAGVCLGFAKNGLETFADQRSSRLHQHVINQLGSNPSAKCLCKKAQVTFDKVGGKCKMSCCKNCEQYIDELLKMKSPSCELQQKNWYNSNVQLWPQEPWEMAKVYMNFGQKGDHKSPKDTDLSGVLNFIDHCIIAKNDISNIYNISKVIIPLRKHAYSNILKISPPKKMKILR